MADSGQVDREQLVRQIVDALDAQAIPGPGGTAAAAARPSWRIIIIIVIEFLQVIQRHLGEDGTITK
jgi:hypothetical protein